MTLSHCSNYSHVTFQVKMSLPSPLFFFLPLISLSPLSQYPFLSFSLSLSVSLLSSPSLHSGANTYIFLHYQLLFVCPPLFPTPFLVLLSPFSTLVLSFLSFLLLSQSTSLLPRDIIKINSK